MPNALTNTNISATYKGVLHANGEPIPDVGLKSVYDGTGVQSALSVGRTNQGATVSGLLSTNDLKVGQLKLPSLDGSDNQVVCRSGTDATGSGVLVLKPISELIGSGPSITPGVYDNPRITVVGGVITKIESRPTITLLDSSTTIIAETNYSLPYNATLALQTFVLPTVNWSTKLGYYADAPTNTISPRYALITVELYAESESLFFTATLEKDSVELARVAIGGNYTQREEYLDRNKYIYSKQMIVKIPEVTNISTFVFKIDVDARTYPNGGTLTRGTENNTGHKVTLDGWVY